MKSDLPRMGNLPLCVETGQESGHPEPEQTAAPPHARHAIGRAVISGCLLLLHLTTCVLYGQWNQAAVLYYYDVSKACFYDFDIQRWEQAGNDALCDSDKMLNYWSSRAEYQTITGLNAVLCAGYVGELAYIAWVLGWKMLYKKEEDTRPEPWLVRPGVQVLNVWKVALLVLAIVIALVMSATGDTTFIFFCLIASPRMLDLLLSIPGFDVFFRALIESCVSILMLLSPFIMFLVVGSCLGMLYWGSDLTKFPWQHGKYTVTVPCLYYQMVQASNNNTLGCSGSELIAAQYGTTGIVADKQPSLDSCDVLRLACIDYCLEKNQAHCCYESLIDTLCGSSAAIAGATFEYSNATCMLSDDTSTLFTDVTVTTSLSSGESTMLKQYIGIKSSTEILPNNYFYSVFPGVLTLFQMFTCDSWSSAIVRGLLSQSDTFSADWWDTGLWQLALNIVTGMIVDGVMKQLANVQQADPACTEAGTDVDEQTNPLYKTSTDLTAQVSELQREVALMNKRMKLLCDKLGVREDEQLGEPTSDVLNM